MASHCDTSVGPGLLPEELIIHLWSSEIVLSLKTQENCSRGPTFLVSNALNVPCLPVLLFIILVHDCNQYVFSSPCGTCINDWKLHSKLKAADVAGFARSHCSGQGSKEIVIVTLFGNL